MNSDNAKNDVFWATRIISLLIGIILILLSILIDNLIVVYNKIIMMTISILSKGISAVGVSLVVGYIMTKIQMEDNKQKEKQAQQQVKDLLQDVVVSADFISELSQDRKTEIIKQCLSNDNLSEQMSKYILYKISKL